MKWVGSGCSGSHPGRRSWTGSRPGNPRSTALSCPAPPIRAILSFRRLPPGRPSSPPRRRATGPWRRCACKPTGWWRICNTASKRWCRSCRKGMVRLWTTSFCSRCCGPLRLSANPASRRRSSAIANGSCSAPGLIGQRPSGRPCRGPSSPDAALPGKAPPLMARIAVFGEYLRGPAGPVWPRHRRSPRTTRPPQAFSHPVRSSRPSASARH